MALVLIVKASDFRLAYKGLKRLGLIVTLISILFSAVFPVGRLYMVSGPYKVGTASMTYTSEIRRELYGKKYDTARAFNIQFYYPADRTGSRRAPMIENSEVVEQGLSKTFGVPRPLTGYLSQLKSNAWYDVGVSELENMYPVVILSHGWKGFKNIHSDTAEQLASEGYIVVSIDHTYGTVGTKMDTGQVRFLNPAALPERSEDDDFLVYASALVNTYRGDIDETIDLLYDMNQTGYNSILSGKMDLSRLALIGHSTGGGAAVLSSMKRDNVKAVIGLDAWVEPAKPSEILSGVHVPYMHLKSEAWRGGFNEANLNMLFSSSTDDRWLITLDGTKHTDFTFLSKLSPLSEFLRLCGPNGKEAHQIQNELTSAFLAYYLKGKNTKTAIGDVIKKYESTRAEAVYMK